MTEDHDGRFRFVVQFVQMFRNRAHGDEARAFDAADSVFSRLPHIDQTQRQAAVDQILHFGGGDFEWEIWHSGEFNRRGPRCFFEVVVRIGVFW